MSVRSRLATAPWPVQVVVIAGVYVLASWPFLRDPEPALFSSMIGLVLLLPVLRALDGQQRRELSGWDRRHRVEVTERARRGELPDTDAARAALRRLIEHDIRANRGSVWLPAVMLGTASIVLLLREADRWPVWSVVGAAWHVLLAVLLTRLALHERAERRGILAALDSA